MSAVMARSPACADFAMYPSATSRPIATRTVETCREGGNRMSLLATKIALTARRSAARMTISFTAEGQASASTKIFTGAKVRESGGAGYLPASLRGVATVRGRWGDACERSRGSQVVPRVRERADESGERAPDPTDRPPARHEGRTARGGERAPPVVVGAIGHPA